MNEIDAYILIGGRSSRLGRDKALVDLDGKTLLQRSIDAVRKGLDPTRLTAVAASAAQFAIDAIVADIPFIFDLHENRGPLGGLHAALDDARTPWVFMLACDYPFVSPELIELLREKIDDEHACIVPEQNDGRLQPLCAFYKVEDATPLVTGIIEERQVPPPMHEIVSRLTPLIVRFEEYSHLKNANRLFVNINTPEDLITANSVD